MLNKAEKQYQEVLKKVADKKRVPLLKIIRMKCLDCCCWQENEVRLCENKDCILHEFRMGKNPIKRILTEKQKEELRVRFAKNMKQS